MQTDINLSRSRSLILPPATSASQQGSLKEIQVKSSVVVVGANGSGKTRLGAWIDLVSPQKPLVHRVGAQKSLSIPEYCSTSSIDDAENTLLYGYYQHNSTSEQLLQYKIGHRWQSKPSTFLQSDYENDQWDWYLLPESGDVPERLLLEILGSRQAILFTEGDRDSLDFFIFSHLFRDFSITPCGSASAVIHSTCSFSNLKHLHSLECKGIIDRDFRSDEQVNHLRNLDIFCLSVSEIENLFLSEEVLRAVGASLHREDMDGIIKKAQDLVFTHMEREKERLVSSIVAARIEDGFLQFDAKALGKIELNRSLETMLSKLDISSLYTEISNSINAILLTRNYSDALRLYNNKGLLPQVSGLFGFKAHELTEYIKRLVSSKNNRVIMEALQGALSELPNLNVITTDSAPIV
ncbi:MAG: DUF4435 domain-containing protein [Nodosilinea sp.]